MLLVSGRQLLQLLLLLVQETGSLKTGTSFLKGYAIRNEFTFLFLRIVKVLFKQDQSGSPFFVIVI